MKFIEKISDNRFIVEIGSGSVTIEDVIKASFEFGWSSRRNFDYDRRK